ncbi:MAG: Translocation protein S62 [Bogoriella megaspora]|nr:MAG: Translocation protein S62 [Bogoriella megaspora]
MSMPMPPLQPGQQPTPEQIRAIQQQIAAEAQKHGLSIPQYIEQMKAQAARQQAMMQQQRQQQGGQAGSGPQSPPQSPQPQQGQQVPIQPGTPPKPEALAVANFLRNQPLKTRTCIFQEKRKDMFKVKRAIRALQSPAYEKARTKNPILPPVTDRPSAENVFKLLPLSVLALRVSKVDPQEGHEGHAHAKKKHVKGLWTVRVEPQQDADDMHHYVWIYDGPQWKQKLYALGALVLIMAVVMFPLWPYHLRLGVWYVSVGCLGLLGAFFGMALVRLILFIVTMFVTPPGLWLFPNLFEDVGFFDSFKPGWAWQETADDKKRSKEERRVKRAEKKARREGRAVEGAGDEKGEVQGDAEKDGQGEAKATGVDVDGEGAKVVPRNMNARVEEVEEE